MKYKHSQFYLYRFILFYGILVLLSIVSILVYMKFGETFFEISINQINYVFSASAQCIAGLFGLTLAGYAFNSNHLEKQKTNDDTIICIIDSLTTINHIMIIMMSVLSILSIITSLVIISMAENNFKNYNGLLSICSILVLYTIVLIIIFACFSTRSKNIKKMSKKLKDEEERIELKKLNREKLKSFFDKKGLIGVFQDLLLIISSMLPLTVNLILGSDKNKPKPGDFVQFTRDYNYIQNRIDEFIAKNELIEPVNNIKRMSNKYKTKVLYEREFIDYDLYTRTNKIIEYRNLVTHSEEVTVSNEMSNNIKMLKDALDNALVET